MINQYPLRGPLADISVGMEFIIIFLGFEVFISFLIKYVRTKQKIRETRNLAFGIMTLGLAITYMFFIFGDYLSTTSEARAQFSLIGYAVLAVSTGIFIIIQERMGDYENKWLLYFGVGVVGLILISTIFSIQILAIIVSTFIALPFVFIYFIYYFIHIIKEIHYSREVIGKVALFFLSLGIIVIGYFLTSDLMVNSLGILIRIIGDGVVIVGLNLFYQSLIRIPEISEFDWMKKIQGLVVLHEDGIALYSRFWKHKDQNEPDENLISGALSTINAVISNMMSGEKERLHIVRLADKTLIFEYKKNIICVIIADEFFETIHSRLKLFSEEFYDLYGNTLKNWKGQMDFGMGDWVADKLFFPIE